MSFTIDHLRCFSCSRRYYSNIRCCERCGSILVAECSAVWETKTPSHEALEKVSPGLILGIVPEMDAYRKREGKKANGRGAGWSENSGGWFNSRPASKNRRKLAAKVGGNGKEKDGGGDTAEEGKPAL